MNKGGGQKVDKNQGVNKPVFGKFSYISVTIRFVRRVVRNDYGNSGNEVIHIGSTVEKPAQNEQWELLLKCFELNLVGPLFWLIWTTQVFSSAVVLRPLVVRFRHLITISGTLQWVYVTSVGPEFR